MCVTNWKSLDFFVHISFCPLYGNLHSWYYNGHDVKSQLLIIKSIQCNVQDRYGGACLVLLSSTRYDGAETLSWHKSKAQAMQRGLLMTTKTNDSRVCTARRPAPMGQSRNGSLRTPGTWPDTGTPSTPPRDITRRRPAVWHRTAGGPNLLRRWHS